MVLVECLHSVSKVSVIITQHLHLILLGKGQFRLSENRCAHARDYTPKPLIFQANYASYHAFFMHCFSSIPSSRRLRAEGVICIHFSSLMEAG